MKEIMTIQVGNFANYVGSHFWNFQDELLGLADNLHGDSACWNHSLNMDVLYRSAEHQGIPSYTPRLISIGTQGSLGSLSSSSLLATHPSTDVSEVFSWKGKISRQLAEPKKRNLFLERLLVEEPEKPYNSGNNFLYEHQKEIKDEDIVESLENDVSYWTDFSKVHYNPRSLMELCTSWVDIEEVTKYGSGNGVFSGGSQGEEITDRLRYFFEECDSVQGIQFIVDDSGGFSSVATDFLESITCDYSKTSVLLYTARSPSSFTSTRNQKPSVISALHDAVSFAQLSNFCHLIVPVGLPSFSASKISEFLSIDDAKPFHSSAVYAASIHCIGLPFRMELPGPTDNSRYISGAMDIGELVHILSGQGWENMVAILDASMPFPHLDDNNGRGSFYKSFLPLNHEVAEDESDDPQEVDSVVIQGAFQSGHRASTLEVRGAVHEANQNRLSTPRFFHLATALCPLPIPLSFPSIFREHVGKTGELISSAVDILRKKGPLEVESIPMGARLRSSRAILPFLEKRVTDLKRFGVCRGAPGMQLLSSWGFSNIEIEEMAENLFKMTTTLDPRPEVSSDSE